MSEQGPGINRRSRGFRRSLGRCSIVPVLYHCELRSAFILVAPRDHDDRDGEKQQFEGREHARDYVGEVPDLCGEREQWLIAMESREEESEQNDGGDETGDG